MSDTVPVSRMPLRALVFTAAALGALLAATLALWMHQGTAVFFEMIRTGLMACFG